MAFPYSATAAYMLSIGVLGLGLGIFYLAELVTHQGAFAAAAIIAGTVLYAIALETLFFRFFLKRWRTIRSYTRTSSG
jgi:hypothetical protein